MIEIVLALIVIIILAIWPVLIPYLLLSYLFLTGLGLDGIDALFTIKAGSINIYPLDFFYILATLCFLVYLIKSLFSYEFKNSNTRETKTTALLCIFFLLFFLAKLLNGFLSDVPHDSLVRMFATHTQMLYFFMPFALYKDVRQIKRLLYFSVILCLIFPFCQPFLMHTKIFRHILQGQGTFRLGHGDANVLLGIGAIALFSWNYKKFLTFLPLSGIMMLAHRSGYIGIVVALMAVSFLKGQKIKSIAMLAVAGTLVIGMMAALQSFTNIDILGKNISRAEETFKNTGTTKARLGAMSQVLEEFEERPMTGFSYKEHVKLNASTSIHDFNVTHPHNFILSAIAETGTLGTLLLFWLLLRSLRIAYKLSKSDIFKHAGVYMFGYILFFIIFSSMNTTMTNTGYVLWFHLGATFWLFNHAKRTT